MKKLMSLFLATMMILSLAACGGTSDTAKAPASGTSSDGKDGTPEKVYTLKMTYTISGDETVAKCAQEMAEKVKERTNGGLVMENYPNGELATDTDALELCAQGANVITFGTPDFLTAYVPDLGVLDGPFLFSDPSEFAKVDESEWMADMRAQLESQGIKNLGMSWLFGARHLTYTGDKAVTGPADLKGMKMRSASSATRVGMMEAMGATVTQMNWSEVYSALQQGVCDGCEAPLSTLYNSKIYEVCKNITLDGHILAIWCVNMSNDVFNSLPEEYQQILVEEIANMGPVTIERVSADEEAYKAKLEAEGVKFYEGDYEAFSEATRSVYDSIPDWSEGLYDTLSAIIKG